MNTFVNFILFPIRKPDITSRALLSPRRYILFIYFRNTLVYFPLDSIAKHRVVKHRRGIDLNSKCSLENIEL